MTEDVENLRRLVTLLKESLAKDYDDARLLDGVGGGNSVEESGLIEIIRDYERLVIWISDLYPRLRPEDHDRFHSLKIETFVSGGTMLLTGALLAANRAGRLASKDPARKEFFRNLAERARSRRHPGSDDTNVLIATMYKLDHSIGSIARRVEISKDAVEKRLRRMFADGRLQKRSRKQNSDV